MRKSILLVLVLSSLATGRVSSPAREAIRGAGSSTSPSQNPTPTPDPAAARQAELEAQVDRTLARLD